MLPFVKFSIHYSTIVIQFNSKRSDLMAELLNEPQLHSASLIFAPSIGKHELGFAR
jgi:hypothetical protein